MEGRCESDRGGDEVYPDTFGNEKKTGLKLDKRCLLMFKKYKTNTGVSQYFQPVFNRMMRLKDLKIHNIRPRAQAKSELGNFG